VTNPACSTCGGRGYTNEVVGSDNRFNPIFHPKSLQFCTDVYPDHDKVPPALRGQPCTPRTNFLSMAPVRTNNYGYRDSVPVQTPKEKAALARSAAAEAKRAAAEKEHKPSRAGGRFTGR
jgi:hypothetical protein